MVALCPLLGLMGTVTGMIEVFHVMAVTGGGDAKAMAGGVSRATIPTMAGMVAALSGLFANTWITRVAENERESLPPSWRLLRLENGRIYRARKSFERGSLRRRNRD